MANNAFIQAMTGLFQVSWELLISVRFPGTEMPVAMMLVGAFVVSSGLRILAFVLSMTVNVGGLAVDTKRVRRGGL